MTLPSTLYFSDQLLFLNIKQYSLDKKKYKIETSNTYHIDNKTAIDTILYIKNLSRQYNKESKYVGKLMRLHFLQQNRIDMMKIININKENTMRIQVNMKTFLRIKLQ